MYTYDSPLLTFHRYKDTTQQSTSPAERRLAHKLHENRALSAFTGPRTGPAHVNILIFVDE